MVHYLCEMQIQKLQKEQKGKNESVSKLAMTCCINEDVYEKDHFKDKKAL